MKVTVVVGGFWGSEGKGHVAQQLADAYREVAPTIVVRVAGPNAGHTVYDHKGNRFALRQIPVGVIYPDVDLVIAPGSEVDPDVLLSEIYELRRHGHDVRGRLWISEYATIITPEHRDVESDRGLTEQLGSTGKGIGAARADRIMRKAQTVGEDAKLLQTLASLGVGFYADVDNVYTSIVYDGRRSRGNTAVEEPRVIVEGTQGYGLGLHTSFYPYTTSSDCRAIDFLAMAGISPWSFDVSQVAVVVVARVYPIRVAGNSGPMKRETSWEALGLPEERTTVTRKVRRVGEFDYDLLREAVKHNGGGHFANHLVTVAITMADQRFPNIADRDIELQRNEEGFGDYNRFVSSVQAAVGSQISMVTTSPTTVIFRDAADKLLS